MVRTRLAALLAIFAGTLAMVSCVGDDPDPLPSAPPTGDGGTSAPDAAGSDVPTCGRTNLACCAGNACEGGSQCNGTICVCPPGTTACGDACVDTKVDAKHCGRCDHDCLGGTCQDAQCAAYTVTTGQKSARDTFSDGKRLYWTRYNSAVSGGLYSVKLDGSDPRTHHDAGAFECMGLAALPDKLYVVCKVTGSSTEIRVCTLPECTGGTTVFRASTPGATSIAADPSSGKVFYVVPTPAGQAPNGSVFDADNNRVGAANQANPVDVVVANGFVYWLNAGTLDGAFLPQKNGGVKRANLGTLGTEAVVGSTTGIYQDHISLAVDDVNAYFTGFQSFQERYDVVVAPATGGEASAFATGAAGRSVASDGTNVYFDDITRNEIRWCSRAAGCSGGGGAVLATNEANTYALSLDESSVLWVNSNGEIRRIAKP